MRVLLPGGIFAVILATAISWLLTNESSPLNEYLLWHPQMRNYWAMLNFPSYLAGASAAGNPHNTNNLIAWAIFLAQWFLSGIIVAALVQILFRRRVLE